MKKAITVEEVDGEGLVALAKFKVGDKASYGVGGNQYDVAEVNIVSPYPEYGPSVEIVRLTGDNAFHFADRLIKCGRFRVTVETSNPSALEALTDTTIIEQHEV